MPEAVIVAAARSPIGSANKGSLPAGPATRSGQEKGTPTFRPAPK